MKKKTNYFVITFKLILLTILLAEMIQVLLPMILKFSIYIISVSDKMHFLQCLIFMKLLYETDDPKFSVYIISV
jgi:hypothetical protein